MSERQDRRPSVDLPRHLHRDEPERTTGVLRGFRTVALTWLATTALLLVVFSAFEGIGVPLLTEPSARLREQSLAVAAVAVALLVVDAVLPVASSVVMVALGSLFGVVGGALLSTLGGLGSLILGAALGRRGQAPLECIVGDVRRRVGDLLDRYGMAAIIATRPIPLVAESTAIVAGAVGMAWWRLLLSGLAGILPVALMYAMVGDRGGQANGLLVAAVLIVVAAGAVLVRAARHRLARASSAEPT